MIKIASIVPYKVIPPVNGGQRHIFYFLNALSEYADITCFTVEENIQWSSDRIKIEPILGSTKNKFRYINPFLISRIKNICKREGINKLIIEHPYYGWLGYALKKLMGFQFIIHSHNIEGVRFKTLRKSWWKILFQYEKFSHRQADLSFFITEEDKAFAIKEFGLKAERCFVSTYGIEATEAPVSEKNEAKREICEEIGVDMSTMLLLFNGVLSYGPNKTAVEKIVGIMNPLLKAKMTQPYKIIICGKADDELRQQLNRAANSEIYYAGFVPDIQQYFLAADIFINPVVEGGGIKTKLVEALAANTPAVSFESGAYGIPQYVTGNCFTVVANDGYEEFADAVVEKLNGPKENIPAAFFEYFNWNQIAKRTIREIELYALVV